VKGYINITLGDDNDVAVTNSETAFISKNGSEITYILDTGVSAHMTPHKNLLRDYQIFKMPKCISAANKGIFNGLGVGTMILPEQINGKNKIILKDMLYAPDIAFTLISIRKCDNAGYKIIFAGQKCIIKNKKGTILLQAPKYHGGYRVDHQPTQFTMNLCLEPIDMHKQLRYISQKSMKALFDQGLTLGLKLKTSKDKIVCDVGIKSKITCKPLPKESRERTKALGEHIYTDVWGPSCHMTINNKYYYIRFMDDYSRESVIYLMKNKSEAFEKYKLYEAMMETQ
jgi:hypothetical protein